MLAPLTTQIVGSYSKPEWLFDRTRRSSVDGSAWRVLPPHLDEARRDAARLALYDLERAGLDLVTDGEAQRPAYDHYFYGRLAGVDVDTLGVLPRHSEIDHVSQTRADRAQDGDWQHSRVPRIVGEIRWPGPLSVDEVVFAKRHARRPLKATVVGPLTSYTKLVDDFYRDEEAAIMALAEALNAEMRALEAAGADVLQIDEPAFHSRFSLAKQLGPAAIERVTRGLAVPVAVHVCYGYAYYRTAKRPSESYADVLELIAGCDRVDAISLEYEQPGHQPDILRHCGAKHVVLGLLNLGSEAVETPEHVAERLGAAVDVVPPERLHPASDCGMWHLPRDVAFGKVSALVEGTDIVRRRLGLPPRKA
ncbi:hypothetical protein [Labrys wisconsinensis]|uniref:5-methyltetrahydropteroyltriglutamate--homocysteine methyltransferase n=1 Tax=Labrys wisconsinensis TaxID=425677 RepID=A0ABU0J512_9HYPH|nr:hypothetical protein [Labrys wisconsinensis]MDQ0469346.1 5-methyltetrahydropteroyltriglutamate--homocysteine methyltransferase [Labrys wisconsinensis]